LAPILKFTVVYFAYFIILLDLYRKKDLLSCSPRKKERPKTRNKINEA
jgi:hypothetical protein